MRVRVGCEFQFEGIGPTPSVWQIRPRMDREHRLVTSSWEGSSLLPVRSYVDSFGNLCDRMVLPEGQTTVRFNAEVEVPAAFDDADKGAAQVPVEDLPDDVLVYLLASRFCLSDTLIDRAWQLFGGTSPGWERVQAICDWTHENIRFQMGSSTPLTTSADILTSGCGVCRDFTHVGIAFCRALNVPARFISGFIPDVAVPPPDAPMDFCSWFEAYLDGRWWTFDPRNNIPRMGRVVIGHGRDAADVAMVTTYGAPEFRSMEVWADEVQSGEGSPE